MRRKMRKFEKIAKLVIVGLSFCLLFSSCGSNSTGESLYSLPKLPEEYGSLEEKIDAILAAGAEYAAPTSGGNLQSVQMVDLDGDGGEEAVAFFRNAADEKPIKIYIFKAYRDTYEQFALIEETASSLYSIAYSDLDGDGYRELLLGFKSGTEVQVLSVYSLRGAQPRNLLTTVYSRYAINDMDNDGKLELMVLYSNEENYAVADYYDWSKTELIVRSTIDLSFSGTELRNVVSGTLSSGEAALFLTGVSDNSVAVTDILVVENSIVQNVTQNASGEVSRFLSLYPTDINGDGITEVPEPIAFPTIEEESEVYYRICWRQYAANGSSQIVYRTFHNTQDGWSLALPEAWDSAIMVNRRSGAEESAVVFSIWKGVNAAPQPFLAICAITGESREYRATVGNRFVLARQVDTIYAAEFLEGNTGWESAIDAETLRESFNLIVAEWVTGEN